VVAVSAAGIAKKGWLDHHRKIIFHAEAPAACDTAGELPRSEGPISPDAVEPVRYVAAAGAAANNAASETGIPSGRIAATFVVAAAVIAFGKSLVLPFVEALSVIALGKALQSERSERQGGLALIKCCKFVYGSGIARHFIHQSESYIRLMNAVLFSDI
jgi:hypothetical protein